jgi:hypothetical protein
MRETQALDRIFNSHSQTETTLYPADRTARLTNRSRCLFRSIFFLQNAALVFGKCPHFGQPCQKQPSTNTATLDLTKTKSGFPGSSLLCIVQPRRPAPTSIARSRRSVVWLPVDLIAPIVLERATGTFSKLPVGSSAFRIRSTDYSQEIWPLAEEHSS